MAASRVRIPPSPFESPAPAGFSLRPSARLGTTRSSALAPDPILVSVEAVGIGRTNGEVLARDVLAVEVRRWGRDAKVRVGSVTGIGGRGRGRCRRRLRCGGGRRGGGGGGGRGGGGRRGRGCWQQPGWAVALRSSV